MQISEAIMANDGTTNQVRITWVDEKNNNIWDADRRGSIPSSIPINVCQSISVAPPIANIAPPNKPTSNL